MASIPRPGLAVLLACAGLLVGVQGTAARADGVFLQFDASNTASTAVAATSRGPFGYGATYATYDGGSSASAAITYSIPLGTVATLKLGPTLGQSYGDDEDHDLRLGAKLGLERYLATSFGSLFLLGEYGSIDNNWFVIAQTGFHNGYGFELSAGGSDNYSDQTLAITKKLGKGPFSLRAGYKFANDEVFVGVSFNTY